MSDLAKDLLEKVCSKYTLPDYFMSPELMCFTGSYLYGTNNKDSDVDIFCLVIPERSYLIKDEFIFNFDYYKKDISRSNLKINHDNKEYEFTFYSISKFFSECIRGNPNKFEILFATDDDIFIKTSKAEYILDKYEYFINGEWINPILGYIRSERKRLFTGKNKGNKRKEQIIEVDGIDIKGAISCLRLIYMTYQLFYLSYIDIKLCGRNAVNYIDFIFNKSYENINDRKMILEFKLDEHIKVIEDHLRNVGEIRLRSKHGSYKLVREILIKCIND